MGPTTRQIIVGIAVLACRVAPARAALIINELQYDPSGADARREWVEILNSGPWSASLSGVALESGDGERGTWSRRWVGGTGDWIDAGQFFVVGGADLEAPPDREAELGLGNGPDGVRLVRAGLELDQVAWGTPQPAGFGEGAPAPLAPALSLARRRDGADTDDNSADFEKALPSPGRPNHPRVDLAVRLDRPGRPLPLVPGVQSVSLHILVENRGSEPIELNLGEVSVVALRDTTTLPLPALALDPGGVWAHPLSLAPAFGPGERAFQATVTAPGDEVPENDRDLLRLWAGDAPLRFSEVLARPDSNGVEWIEIRASLAVDLEGWALEDASGTRLDLPSIAMNAGSYLVLQQDASGTSWSGSWPSLNDQAGRGAAADSLFLVDPTGLVEEWMWFGRSAAGVSWIPDPTAPAGEAPDAWGPAPGEPTPGEPNPPGSNSELIPREELEVVSLRLAPEGVWIGLDASLFPGDWNLRIFDLEGRRVWSGSGSERDARPRSIRWPAVEADGTPCAAGIYLLELESRSAAHPLLMERQPFVVAR